MRVPSLRLHKPSGLGVVTINGRDLYLGKYGTAKCNNAYARAIAELFATGSVAASKNASCTINEALSSYVQARKIEFGGSQLSRADLLRTGYGDIILALRPLRKIYGDTLIEEFGPQQLKAVRGHLLTQHVNGKRKDGKPLKQICRSTINRRIQAIVRFFKFAVQDGKVNPSVWQSLLAVESLGKGKSTAPESRKVKPVDDAIVEKTLPCLPPVVADMVRLQRLTGARPGEICKITPSMVDRSNPKCWVIDFEKHKTAHRDKIRKLFLGTKEQAILGQYLSRDPSAACFTPREAQEQRLATRAAKRVTPENQGNRRGYGRSTRARSKRASFQASYNSSSYLKAVYYACELAWPAPEGLSKKELAAWRAEHRWSPNQLRHTRATELRKRHGIEAARVILGHSSVATSEIYAEKDFSEAMRIAMNQ